MAKKTTKKEEYKIVKKRSGKYMIFTKGGSTINADQKVKILEDKGLIKKMTPKKKEAPAEEAAATTEPAAATTEGASE